MQTRHSEQVGHTEGSAESSRPLLLVSVEHSSCEFTISCVLLCSVVVRISLCVV